MAESTTQIDTGGMDDDGEGFDPAVTTLSVAAVRGREPRAVDDLLEPAVIARLLRDPSEVYTAVRQLHLVSWSAPELMHDHLPALLAALSTTDNLSVRLEVLLSLVNFSADQPGARAIVKAGGLPQLSRQLIVAVSATGAEAQCVPPLCAALRNLAVEPETCLRIAEARCVPPLLKVLPSKAVPWEARHDALLVLWQVHACALHAHHTASCKHGTLHSYSAHTALPVSWQLSTSDAGVGMLLRHGAAHTLPGLLNASLAGGSGTDEAGGSVGEAGSSEGGMAGGASEWTMGCVALMCNLATAASGAAALVAAGGVHVLLRLHT